MSRIDGARAGEAEPGGCAAVEMVIRGRARDIGGLNVARLLPYAKRRAVGPFVFFDRMGPVSFDPGTGLDVPPHPHIGLATLTYLFAGAIVHRDSLGTVMTIRPGAVNLMTAGHGVAHSERMAPEDRASGMVLDGVQIWLAQSQGDEQGAPASAIMPPTICRSCASLPVSACGWWRARPSAPGRRCRPRRRAVPGHHAGCRLRDRDPRRRAGACAGDHLGRCRDRWRGA
ncbi:pirin family protein [Tistrella bauzanensis]